MTLGIISWCIAAVFMLSLSYLVHRQLRSNTTAINAVSFVFLTIFLTTLLLMLVGLGGFLKPLPLALISISGMIGILAIPGLRRSWMEGFEEWRRATGALRLWWMEFPLWLKWFSVLFVIISTTRFIFLVLALPPFTWDSLTYHLTNVAEWTQQGRITLFETPVQRIYSPSNYEVFTTWFTVFLHHDVVVEASGIPGYVLACLAVYAIGRTVGLTRWAAWVGTLGYASTPALLLSTTGTKNDPVMAGLYLMALAIVFDLSFRRDECESRNAPGQFVLLAACLLYAVGTKPYIMHFTPGLIVAGIVASMQARNGAFWMSLPRQIASRFRKYRKTFLIVVVVILLAAMFLGFYWYVRNYCLTGNPFYPYGVEISGTMLLDAKHGNPAQFSLANLIKNLEVLAEKFGDKQFRIVTDLPETTGWGWVAYGLGLPALAWALVRKPKLRTLALGFILSLLTLFLSNPTTAWNMRYIVWLPALMSICVAAVLQWMSKVEKASFAILSLMLVLSIGLNLAMVLNYNKVSVERFQKMLSFPLLEREAATLKMNVPGEYENAIDFVPEDEILGYNVHGNGFIYPLYRADLSQRLVYVPFSASDTCEQVAQKVRDRGTRWLFVAPEHSIDQNIALLRTCSDSDTIIRERARGLYVID